MANNQKDLVSQSYEIKIASTLRSEKYELFAVKKHQNFIDALVIDLNSAKGLANKFYKEQIEKLKDSYAEDFNEIVLPLIREKGLNFEVPEEELQNCIEKYSRQIESIVDKLQIIGRLPIADFYNKDVITENWSICLDGVVNMPFLLSLGSKRMIILDEKFNMDLHLFASMGAIPDIRPITKVGNIDLPPETYSINLQIMLGTGFEKVSILLLKQSLSNIGSFLKLMNNISLIVDTKSYVDEDFSGLKWIKNSLQHSLFKRKEFLEIARTMKTGGLIIDKSVSPMQAKKIQSLMKSTANLDIGFEVNKLGTIQYSVITKKDNFSLAFDDFDKVICKVPDMGSSMNNKYASY